MKNIKYFLIFLALLIVVVVAVNYSKSKPNKAKENPYEYNVDEYKKVDPALITYKESRQLKVELDEHAGLATFDGNIYLASNQTLMVISPDGSKISEFTIQPDARALAVNDKSIAVAYKQIIENYNLVGTLMSTTEVISDSSYFTSIVFWNNKTLVADAGKRRIYEFDGPNLIDEMEGVSGAKNLHGFIIPSPYFEVAVNNNDQLWCTNPGMHALQQYNEKGDLVDSWDKASLDIDGFNGCCNPAQFTFLPDGRFITSEKGMPRLKIYTKNGELESVIASPSKFEGNQHAAEVATIGETVIALDFDRKMIRIFEPKSN
ncbi:MAG: hypothetical protein ACERKD_01300 [Prolixibacteraceae bacterium]